MWWQRYVLTFLVVALAGLVVRAYGAEMIGDLFGAEALILDSWYPGCSCRRS